MTFRAKIAVIGLIAARCGVPVSGTFDGSIVVVGAVPHAVADAQPDFGVGPDCTSATIG